MTKLQFRVLYREFLFRMVDLELLSASAQGDISKLLGQFAGLLIFLSALLALSAILLDTHTPPEKLLIELRSMEHFLISTTMLVVGLFAVLGWDSMFPDRRDVLVLVPLPIRGRTLLVAKVAAVAASLSLTVAALHVVAGFTWPLILAPAHGGALGVVRSIAGYWITMLSAGAFIFCCVLGVQGLGALLPRRIFLRLSAFLQMAAFCLSVSVYFLEPSLTTPEELAAAQNQRLLAWLPSYWFLGLFQLLNGSMQPAFAPLARRALIGLAIAGCGAAVAYALSYFRVLRRIVEEPDIVPGARRLHWPPRFGNSLATTVVLFSIRTLLRSRRHRVMLAFYLGIGFAIVILFMKTPRAQQQLLTANVPLLFSSAVMMSCCVIGTRVVFAMPLDLRANWIFRMTEIRGPHEYLAAIRRPLFVLAVVPVWAASATLFLAIWPWRLAWSHLAVLGLWGIILSYACLFSFQKIPFTCSYLPGKMYINIVFLGAMAFLLLLLKAVEFERIALENLADYVQLLVILVIATVCARWLIVAQATSEEAVVEFEEVQQPEVFVLGLYRDGVMPIGPGPAPPNRHG
jgi:hypothetical protein